MKSHTIVPKHRKLILCAAIAGLLQTTSVLGTNPLIMDQFTADPTARVFEDRIYVYPSHDIKAPAGYKGKPNWFVMEDYHVFSSANLTDWKDHGVILTQKNVPWVDAEKYSMWAPDAVFKNGKYYFYFPAMPKGTEGFNIGVAVADKPYGPFQPLPQPIAGVKGIDPNVLIDADGQAYLYWSANKIFVAKLRANMTEIEGEPKVIENLPQKGLIEGPFVFKRNGIYYLTYPHVANEIERLEYATSASPMGPFKHAGVLLDESESGCWTVHHSMLEWRGQWYLFYHDRDLSPTFDKNRSIRADRLFFEKDGTIRKVVPTLRGVGLVNAESEIQIDRYSAKSEHVSVAFLDERNVHAGWKSTFAAPKSWLRFADVDFARGEQKSVEVRAKSAEGAVLDVRLGDQSGPVLARVGVRPGAEWSTLSVAPKNIKAGVQDLVVTHVSGGAVEVDWIRFR